MKLDRRRCEFGELGEAMEGMGRVFGIVRMSGFLEWVWNLNGMSNDGRKCIEYWFEFEQKILDNKHYFLFYKPKKRNNMLDVIFIIFKWERLAIETIDKYTSVPLCNTHFKFLLEIKTVHFKFYFPSNTNHTYLSQPDRVQHPSPINETIPINLRQGRGIFRRLHTRQWNRIPCTPARV